MRRNLALCTLGVLFAITTGPIFGQSLGNAGTIQGIVVDPSGAAVPGAMVTIRNPVSGYSQSATTAADGSFRFTNIPPNPYHLEVTASGFAAFAEDVTVRKRDTGSG
jgi:hypothetical protein